MDAPRKSKTWKKRDRSLTREGAQKLDGAPSDALYAALPPRCCLDCGVVAAADNTGVFYQRRPQGHVVPYFNSRCFACRRAMMSRIRCEPTVVGFFGYVARSCVSHVAIRLKIPRHEAAKHVKIAADACQRLFDAQGGACVHCRRPLVTTPHSPRTASLNRIDNDGAYVESNVEFVCLNCQYALIDFRRDVAAAFLAQVRLHAPLGGSYAPDEARYVDAKEKWNDEADRRGRIAYWLHNAIGNAGDGKRRKIAPQASGGGNQISPPNFARKRQILGEVFARQGGLDALTGIPLSLTEERLPTRASIYIVDRSLGYSASFENATENILLVGMYTNYGRNRFSDAETCEWIDALRSAKQ